MDFQSQAAIIFIIILAIVLFYGRRKLQIQKIVWPFLYMIMYRTKVGIDFMDRAAKRFPRFFKYAGYLGVFIGFVGMGMICYSLVENLIKMILVPKTASTAALVLPFKVKGAVYVPFFFWIICIFILVVIHEFSHGVISRLYKLKIKSSGLAFLGIILPVVPAAFVEPDEKKLSRKPRREQLSVFAAGSFSNIVLGFLCLLLLSVVMFPLVNSLTMHNGVAVTGLIENGNKSLPAEKAGISEGEIILEIDNSSIRKIKNLSEHLDSKSPGDVVFVRTNRTTYSFELASNPENSSLPYMGIYLADYLETKPVSPGDAFMGVLRGGDGSSEQAVQFLVAQAAGLGRVPVIVNDTAGLGFSMSAVMWISGLLFWLFLLNIGIGLFNLAPIPITDGGKMLYLALLHYFDKKRAMNIWKYAALFFIALIIINVAMGFF